MNKVIMPSEISGEVRAPSSKSMMQRSIVAALLAEGETTLFNPSYCDDARAALMISEMLGAEVHSGSAEVRIKGGYNPRNEMLNCGESGLGIRMFSAIAALHHSDLYLTGHGSLLSRPLSMIESPLQQLGADCQTTGGSIPVRVKGPLRGGRATVDGSVSSQFLTGLLMALPVASGDSELRVTNLRSKPYIDLTIQVLDDFGIRIENYDYSRFTVKGNQQYMAREYTVEGDWSGTAFLLVAGALNGWVRVTGIRPDSVQADRMILEALTQAGAGVVTSPDSVEITRNRLLPFRFDAAECPDLFPPLVALAAHCNGITELTGARRLLSKESNRAAVLQKEFCGVGVPIEVENDRMIVYGGGMNAGTICSTNDHRIAMAAAVAGVRAGGKIDIAGYECISKSYPDFFRDFKTIGGIAYE